ncbi:MAG: UDP-N-acetylmuramoyl-tripeptide--D-alanyl-D-alanine ligase, partial [Clostridia bacterium]|nr:UDP-N-acetylmuramoyl-tripeptide--D-alanyl-D-alanine ligase [Clostridia bacterium]
DSGITIINDAYNASFESMKATLEYLSEFKEKRKIAILGDMFELGDYSKELHKNVGEEVYKNDIDILICNGKNAEYIVYGAKEKGMNEKYIYYISEKDNVIPTLRKIVKNDDILLFKASNGMKFYELAEEVKNTF